MNKIKSSHQKSNRDDIRLRLQQVHRGMDNSNSITMEQSLELLKSRAKKLAATSDECIKPSSVLEVTKVLIGDDIYAIESLFIGEVIPLKNLTQIPCTPSFVLGVINIRGKLMSVVDLKSFLGISGSINKEQDRNTQKVVVLKHKEMEFGIHVDGVLSSDQIFTDAILETLFVNDSRMSSFYRGVTKDHIIIIDVLKLLTDEKIIVNESIE